ncbi:lanthionine synthetase C family protein [Aquimarina mytili]|uniref:Lanthionine synthetase C family protein n=1 Tax=Aquimarina mytili TaxID=874423 RepID=A0A936ZTG5_9FLAO|nr:lanthionine synthetase C family protein [Aquimarina mytili]MBL0685274.1 lanthionine synthetase C family protein [Aquimarina mytili]
MHLAYTEELEKQLVTIHSILRDHYAENSEVGVLSGISGISLFHFYYSKYLETDVHFDTGIEVLSESVHRINNGYNFPTYCTGIAGAGWVFDHLVEEDFVDLDTDELLSDLDEYLYGIMMSNIKEGNYDFLHGAIGYGYYFLKRYRNTKSDVLKERYVEYLLSLVSVLEQISENDKEGIKWPQVVHKKTEAQEYNFGLSHGISGIINFLSRLHQYEEFKNAVETLLKGGTAYLVRFENPDSTAFSLFPNNVTDTTRGVDSRLAWCYGDLGIGLSLRLAAKALKDDELYQTSIRVLKHATQRKTIEQSLVKDAGLCHGSYGNAQIFGRLYRETNDEVFKEAATHWIEQGLAMATFEDGYAGYKAWQGKENEWKNETNFLTGVAGIGLAILFYLSDVEVTWDECLMIG